MLMQLKKCQAGLKRVVQIHEMVIQDWAIGEQGVEFAGLNAKNAGCWAQFNTIQWD